MQTSKHTFRSIFSVILLILIVLAMAYFVPRLIGEPSDGQDQPSLAISITDPAYPHPAAETPTVPLQDEGYPSPLSETPASPILTPEVVATFDTTPTVSGVEKLTITPVPLPTMAGDVEGEILFVEYSSETQESKMMKVKVDKEGKAKTGSEKTSLNPDYLSMIIEIYLSPDQNQLVATYDTEGPSANLIDISSWKVDQDPLVPFSYNAFLGWHADSRHILVSTPNGLRLVDTQDHTTILLVMSGAEGKQIGAAASSPDGTQVVYNTHHYSGRSEIWMVSADGQNPRMITDERGAIWFAWSPDGSRIAFWSGGYYLMNADGSNMHLLSELKNRGGFSSRMPAMWSPDGRYLLTDTTGHEVEGTSIYTGSNIYLIDTESGETMPVLIDGSTGHLYPAWSPDGKMIAFLSLREGSVDAWVVNLDGSNLHRITSDGKVKVLTVWHK